MDDQYFSFKNIEANSDGAQVLPALQSWRKLKSSHALFEPRSPVVPIVLRLAAVATLYLYAPTLLVFIWCILIFSTYYCLHSLITAYSALLKMRPTSLVMTDQLMQIFQRYKMSWYANSFAWCGLSFLSQMWLPITGRLLCLAILNVIMLLAVARTYVDRTLMHQVSAVFIGMQMFFLMLRLSIQGSSAEPDMQAIIYIIYLIFMSYLLWTFGNKLNSIHIERLNFEHSKLALIESLNTSKEQLYLEQQALIASNKLVQQFYSGAAHDLRQPVYAMQLYATMLAEDPSSNEVLLPKILQSCVAINDMFNTLFDYQQTHLNDTILVEKTIDIQEFFKSLELHFQPIATGKGLQIRFKPVLGSITIVPLYLVRILSNLITNGLRYTNSGGVLVGMRKTANSIRFEIWDTGIGIDESKIQFIFTEFYKINTPNDNEQAHSDKGLGLGLSIVKQLSSRIAQTEISVQSRVGRGSVFKFVMPIARYRQGTVIAEIDS